jgi:hypothetical protein
VPGQQTGPSMVEMNERMYSASLAIPRNGLAGAQTW